VLAVLIRLEEEPIQHGTLSMMSELLRAIDSVKGNSEISKVLR